MLVIGPDGCGKSTLLNSLIKGPSSLSRDSTDGSIDTKEVLTFQGLPSFVIGSGMKAEVPDLYEHDGILFAEAPRTTKDNQLWGT